MMILSGFLVMKKKFKTMAEAKTAINQHSIYVDGRLVLEDNYVDIGKHVVERKGKDGWKEELELLE